MSHCSFCEMTEAQAIEAERERIVQLLDGLHQESGQIAHITNRSGVCKTCRAIALIEKEN